MKFISLCSGIEAASVALEPLGWQAIAFAEIDKFPCAVLAHHYPHVPNFGDISKFLDWPDEIFADADVIVGGPPCQAFSIAGLRNGLNDARGNLTLVYVDLINHADTIRRKYGRTPVIAIYENVPGLLSDKTGAFGCFLGALSGEDDQLVPPGKKWSNAGCVFGPQRTIAWRVTDAQYFGVPQRRRRVFVVASARKGFDPTEVLFEFDGVRRDTAPSRQTGQDAAATIAGGARSRGGYSHDDIPLTAGTIRASDGGANVDQAMAGHILTCVSNAEGSTGLPFLTCSNIAKTVNNQTPLMSFANAGHFGGMREVDVSDPLRAKGGDTGNGGETLALSPIAFDSRQDCVSSTDVFGALGSSSPQAQAVTYAIQAGALRTNPNSGPDGVGVQESIAYTLEARAEVQAVCITGDITHTLKAEGFDASEDGTGRGQPIVAAYSSATEFLPQSSRVYSDGEISPTLQAAGTRNGNRTPQIQAGMAVRRLTPRECERLQAFPDFHTLIPISVVKASRAETMLAKGDPVECIDGVWWKMAADGPRYKALGNSMCTNNIFWIGKRIEAVLAAHG